MISDAACQICGVKLSDPRDRLMQVCRGAKCQIAWSSRLQAQRKAELQMERARRTRLAEEHRDRNALRRGLGDVQDILPVVVPANLRKIVKLPERRKRAFRKYLRGIIAEAAAVRAKSADAPRGETALDSSTLPPKLSSLLGRGCATCRGRCCNGGGDHAYLSVETILGYMHHHPKHRPREVLDAYLSHLPNKAYEDSCVYQTKKGCALPRKMRSKISGDFFCEELRQFERQFYAEGERQVMFYAFEDRQIVRSEPFPDETCEPVCKADEANT
jgi:hypothetical protein